ncbi:hypothetical protein [Acuticoccus mangrovi]|uniref:Uncharacterized protein n=1 Tax=Acuticoccus mangrovi TaxID=2796142 RepID=A0A934MI87_9HYPH|nr:hypothetical protein [Acuticoccus mangrovi]MBJ3778498.1 hypothetical protein [Acuticoccus mangrovi]
MANDDITTEPNGRGPEDEDTPRAGNRRVEIVIVDDSPQDPTPETETFIEDGDDAFVFAPPRTGDTGPADFATDLAAPDETPPADPDLAGDDGGLFPFDVGHGFSDLPDLFG